MLKENLSLTLEDSKGRTQLDLEIKRLIVAGWVGKDKQAVAKHIKELGELGVPAPSRTPTYMNLSPTALTTEKVMEVVGPESSGEVECVIIKGGEEMYLGVGSDHTDRDFEKYGIPASKQMCAKPVASTVWRLDDIKGHLDQLVLRAWMTIKGERRLYQEGVLADNLNLLDIAADIPPEEDSNLDAFCLFGGTFPALGGIAYGEFFEFEMEDPVLGRKISHSYQLKVLPQYL